MFSVKNAGTLLVTRFIRSCNIGTNKKHINKIRTHQGREGGPLSYGGVCLCEKKEDDYGRNQKSAPDADAFAELGE